MIIEVSVAILAAAFVVIAICVVLLTISLRATLERTDQTLGDVRLQLNARGMEIGNLLSQADHITAEVKNKIGNLTPLFNTFASAGEVLEQKTALYKNKQATILTTLVHEDKEKAVEVEEASAVADILEIAGLSMRLWRKFKQRR